MELQTKVTLPSNGKLYKTKEVTIKPMTSEDFDIINDTTDTEFIYKVIQNSIVEPKELSIQDLHPFDVDAILYALRNLSIGPTYEQTVICPYCKKQQSVEVDMDQWETEVLDKSPIQSIKMPNGDTVILKVLTEGLQADTRERAKGNYKQLSFYHMVSLVKSIKLKEPLTPHPNVTVDEISTEDEIEDYVRELSFKDRLYLQQATVQMPFGVDSSFMATCSEPNCHKEFRVIGAIDGVTAPEFFRPTLFKA